MADLALENLNWEKAAKIFSPLAAGGLISLALIAPPFASFLAKEICWHERSKFNQRLERLKKRKLINITYQNGETSVLIYPYPCPDEIEFIRQVFDVGKEVTYLTTDRFEEDGYYYNWFFASE